ncbi:MAG: hypothetical protein ACOC5A_00575 [Halanaerobiales bacterium]
MQISNLDLDNLRHLVIGEQVQSEKSRAYAEQVSNPQLKSFLSHRAEQAEQNVQKLSQFLNQY